MDFTTDLPESDEYDTILVVIDCLTKISHFISCKKSLDAWQFTRLFMQHIVRLHGIPRDISTDRGSLFTSGLWKQITEKLGIERRLSTAFHPQTDGQTERTNAILAQYLRAYVNYLQDNWNELLPQAEFAYNNGYQETIKTTPFYVKLWKESRTSTDESSDYGKRNFGKRYGKSAPDITRRNDDSAIKTEGKLR